MGSIIGEIDVYLRKTRMNDTLKITLPGWIEGFVANEPRQFIDAETRMRLAIELARENIRQNTGGPFGAAVFNMDTNELVSVGVNCVVPSDCSMAHAEIMAIGLAQQALGTFDLSSKGRFELATSCQPCAMCLGAVPWSGIKSLLCGAREEDARAVGFDEGAKPDDWLGELQNRGITVTRDILRTEAAQVLKNYAAANGTIYNPGS